MPGIIRSWSDRGVAGSLSATTPAPAWTPDWKDNDQQYYHVDVAGWRAEVADKIVKEVGDRLRFLGRVAVLHRVEAPGRLHRAVRIALEFGGQSRRTQCQRAIGWQGSRAESGGKSASS